MKATAAKFLEFLKKSQGFAIPIYQRTYSWTERECRQLWDDIVRAGSNDKVSAHFVGSIVYIEDGLYQVMNQSPLLVIDGQQRLTTISLLLAALAQAVDGFEEAKREPIDGFSPRKIRNYYLLNPEEDGDQHYKLLLTQTDRLTLISIVGNTPEPENRSVRVKENFGLFQSWIAGCGAELACVCKGLAKLVVVDIALSRDQDNPQLIFESMNSTGKELSQADLIRNFILMGLKPQLQTHLYEHYWRPMEVDFGQRAYTELFDGFMRHYLTVKTGAIPNVSEVYEAFKVYARLPETAQKGVESLVADIRNFSKYYCAIALGKEPNSELKEAFGDLRDLRVDVAYPFLLELYGDYKNGLLTAQDFVTVLRLVESFVFRRQACALPTNSHNKIFATFSKSIQKEQYLQSVQAQFALLPSSRRFPDDDEFCREIQRKDLYNYRNCRYWLERIENHGRKERVEVTEYTIEHILPQNPDLSSDWKKDLGPEWEQVQKSWLHTLGNLTLTGYNSEYSDKKFSDKRDMVGGFKESPLRLNQGLGQLDIWNEETIKDRAKKLSNLALQVWPAPSVSADVLANLKARAAATGYSISDHPPLLGAMSAVFEALRKQVLAIDPCVTEEFLKLYVAYKAETNFVDIIPQAKRLLLSLNIDFSEIHDPKGLATDVSGKGTWGNGDVEVSVHSLDQIQDTMMLVRQAFEHQMGGNGGNGRNHEQ